MIFLNDEHENFFKEKTSIKFLDCYHLSVIYLLGLSEDTRNHFDEIYDIQKGIINPSVLEAPWQTTSNLCITRLAFNLFNDCMLGEPSDYTVSNIFGRRTNLAPYFYQAIKIRFEF